MKISEETKENKLIAIYGRVSSSNQENEGTIETQLSAVKEFAAKNNYIIVQQYTDEGWSGDSLERPALDRLRSDVTKKIWQAVLIYDPDRLARRYSYQELVTDELREKDAEIIYVTTPAPQNGIEKILFGVQGLFAEYERAKIIERFRLGKVRKAREGHIMASEAPYGYTFIPKKGKKGEENFRHGYYEINEREAQVVRAIFSWVACENLTIHKVVLRLSELGIMPRKSKRCVWSRSTIGHILRNRTYIGEGHYGSTYASVPLKPIKRDLYKKIKKTSRKLRPENEWILIPTPKILEEDLFNQVAKKLKENFNTSKRNRKNNYLLSGKIYCICGARRAGQGSKQTSQSYYRCTERIHRFPLPGICKEKGINVIIADKIVWNKIVQIMSSADLLQSQLDRWGKKIKNKPSKEMINAGLIEGEIKKLKEQEERFLKAYGTGAISLEQFRQYANPLKEKITRQQNLLKQNSTEDTGIKTIHLPSSAQIAEFAVKAAEKMKTLPFEKSKQIADAIIKRVSGTSTQLSVNGNIPVNIFNNVLFCPEYRHRQDTIEPFSENVERKDLQIPFEFTTEIISGRWINKERQS